LRRQHPRTGAKYRSLSVSRQEIGRGSDSEDGRPRRVGAKLIVQFYNNSATDGHYKHFDQLLENRLYLASPA
jgi:hypothetical protein